MRDRYVTGVEKLDFAGKNVKEMQEQLIALQPVLAQSQKETEALMEQVEAKLPGVEALKNKVEAEAAVVQGETDKVDATKKECEDDLAEAIPILNGAIAALNTLKSL